MMKKLLGIVVLGLLWCNTSFAFNYLSDFGATGGGGGFIALILIGLLIFGLIKGSKDTRRTILMYIGIIFLIPLLFIIIANEMGIFGFLYLGILASLFYIIPKVAMPKDTHPKTLKRKKRRRRK